MDVARDAREAGVYDCADSRNSHRSLGDIRREDDAAARREAERALLLAGGQGREKGDDVVRGEGGRATQVVGGLSNVSLAGKKNKNVVFRRKRRERGGYVAREIALLAVRRIHVAYLDRIEPSRDRYRRRAVEEGGEALGVERRGGDDHLQVTAFREDALEDAEEEVDV